MDIMAKIQELLVENKKTQKELSFYLGLKPQAFSEWKANRNTSYMKRLPEIARFFGVSLDVFFDAPAPAAQKEQPALNEDEPIDEVKRKLHAIIDTLSESDKEAMLFMAQSLMQRGEKQ